MKFSKKISSLLFFSFVSIATSVGADEPTSEDTLPFPASKKLEKEKVVSNQEMEKGNYFYLKIGSGASFARKARVYAPPAEWDPSIQGYNSGLGTRPIFTAGLGYEFCRAVAAEIMASYRPNFKYRKYQIVPPNATTPGLLPNKTRAFDLDVTSLMGSVYLSGHGCDIFNWSFYGNQSIYPIIGGGLGASQLKIFNFRSTGLPAVNPQVDPSLSFGSENQYTIRYNFTYQVFGGFEYRYGNRWALSTGYRWFDAGKFRGPQYLRDPNGIAGAIPSSDTWKIHFASNEIFLELKILL